MSNAVEAPSGENFLIGNGEVFFAELFASGLPKGERHVGNCTQFAQTVSPTKLEKRSRMNAARGVIKTTAVTTDVTIQISMDEATLENLALASLGAVASNNQSTATVTDEDMPDPDWEFGLWYKLTKRKISSVVVEHVIAGPADETLVLGTDYELDTDLGRIKFLSTGNAVEGELMKISYTAAAITLSSKITVASETSAKRYVRFRGDPSEGPTYDAEFWCVDFAPNGEVALIQDEWGAFVLTGTVLADTTNHPTEPFGIIAERE